MIHVNSSKNQKTTVMDHHLHEHILYETRLAYDDINSKCNQSTSPDQKRPRRKYLNYFSLTPEAGSTHFSASSCMVKSSTIPHFWK